MKSVMWAPLNGDGNVSLTSVFVAGWHERGLQGHGGENWISAASVSLKDKLNLSLVSIGPPAPSGVPTRLQPSPHE